MHPFLFFFNFCSCLFETPVYLDLVVIHFTVHVHNHCILNSTLCSYPLTYSFRKLKVSLIQNWIFLCKIKSVFLFIFLLHNEVFTFSENGENLIGAQPRITPQALNWINMVICFLLLSCFLQMSSSLLCSVVFSNVSRISTRKEILLYLVLFCPAKSINSFFHIQFVGFR